MNRWKQEFHCREQKSTVNQWMEYYSKKAHGSLLESFLFLIQCTEVFHLRSSTWVAGIGTGKRSITLRTKGGSGNRRRTWIAPRMTAHGPNQEGIPLAVGLYPFRRRVSNSITRIPDPLDMSHSSQKQAEILKLQFTSCLTVVRPPSHFFVYTSKLYLFGAI